MKAKKFPQVIVVRWEDTGDGDFYLAATEAPHEIAELGSTQRAATYKLIQEIDVVATVAVKVRKVRR